MKRCRDCGELKPLTDFPPAGRSKDGRGTYCRVCFNVRSKASYRKRQTAAGRDVREPSVAPEGHKLCPECGEVKPFADFPRNKRTRTGSATYCKPCHNARSQETRQRLYGGGREYHLQARYGIGQAEVDQMLAAQSHKCAVCGKPDPEHVDHDHKTGAVRGMLCFKCNQALGNVRDDIVILGKLQDYLLASLPPTVKIPVLEVRLHQAIVEWAGKTHAGHVAR